jgi:uncharacterized pyridoxamine 5'-phosphate oxidase family protein
MEKSDVYRFINENPVAFVATVEGDTPRVRGFMTVRADEKGLLFNTGTGKDVHRQLGKNPKIELCYYSPAANEQVRVSGRVEFADDPGTREAVLEKFTFLKPVVEKQGPGILAPFYVREAKACHWNFRKNFEAKRWVEL